MVPVVLVTVSEVLPAVLVPEAAILASPLEMQVELNVTVTEAAVYSVPVWSTTVTVRLVVPPAATDALEIPIMPDWKELPVPLPIE